MMKNNLTTKLNDSSFIFNDDIKVWTKEKVAPFMYSDGDEAENYLISVLEQTQDHSVFSDELKPWIKDWPSLYHLSSRRSNLLQPFKSWFNGKRVLEIGCGCGAITRFLAEAGATVISVEGSIRRARIASKRCADLENVTVICCPSDQLPDLGEFDAVMLIGVLEYASMFLGTDGDTTLLQNCRERLNNNGCLFVAIENKIGAKYLAGANEDHLAVPMVGVNDAYKDKSVRTYARQELINKLTGAGFPQTQEFVPLPDYKLPVTVVSPIGTTKYSPQLSSLAVESVAADMQGVADYHFSLEQFNHVVWQNSLAPELSNSFLMVAGNNISEIFNQRILAWHYSDARSQENNKETVFKLDDNEQINVISKSLSIENDEISINEPFYQGESLWREVVRIVNLRDWTVSELTDVFIKWLKVISSPSDDVIPSFENTISNDYFDALPFNIINDGNGGYTIFDREWDNGKTSKFGLIAWRGVFHSLFRIKSYESSSSVFAKTYFDLASQVLQHIWPDIPSTAFLEWAEEEARFSVEVTGRDNYQSLLDVALNSTISYRVNVTTLKQQITIQENELLATKVHVDNLTTQLDWQANELDRLQNELSHQAKSATVLAESLKKIEEEKALMFNSLSWKLTKPLRFTKRVALALSRRGTPKNMHLKNKLSRLNKVLNLKKNQLGGYTQLALWSYQRYRSYGYTGFISKLKRAMNPVPVSSNAVPVYEYEQWIEKHENIDSVKLTAFSSRLASFEHLPTISIVMPCYNAPVKYLCEAIESVRNQIYSRWELCIADDASTSEETVLKLKEYAALDPRIKITFRSKNGHISNASNSAIELVTGEYVALMDQDDLLPRHALYKVVEAINNQPDVQLIYSDEDKISADGVRCEPYFKADWNRDLFLSQNMFSHLGVFSKSLIDKVGGFRPGLEGSQDYDLVLRCLDHVTENQIVHIPEILYHWRIIPGSTASGGEQKPYAFLAGIRAVQEYLERNNIAAQVEEAKQGMLMLRVKYNLPKQLPLVSIIIPTRNAKALVKQCIDSIFEKTTYSNFEIILVDNGSDDPSSLDYFAELNERDNIRVVRDDGNFNFSRLNNEAVKVAKGELLCLMNNDIEVISPDWLDEMVSQAVRPEIGAVGAKLLYPNDTVQHAGVILGLGGIAGHAHLGIHRNDPGYFGRANLVQNFIAVTAACLVIRKEIYENVGGLNEKDFAVAFNDVDFCIRVHQAGYHNLWTPFAEMYHHESATRGSDLAPEKIERFKQEIKSMELLYGNILFNDPAYNPNLSLDLSFGSFALKR
ncbi:glycosyltransferase [Escherichia coli]|nr:glycosyltransferase [Escherichia coli]